MTSALGEVREGVVHVRGACGSRFLVKEPWAARLFLDGEFLAPSQVRGEKILKRTTSRLVRLVSLEGGGDVVVKTYLPRTGWDGLTSLMGARLPKDAEWVAGNFAHEAGLTAAEPLAIGTRRGSPGLSPGLKHERVLVTRAIPECQDLAELQRLGKLDFESRRRFASALGSLVRRMHDAGVFPRDPHMGNFLVRDDGEECVVDPIDLREVRIIPQSSEEERREHLLLMFQTCGYLGGRTDRLRFLRRYLGDVSRDHLVGTARFLEQEALEEIRRYRLKRSGAALGENRRFGIERHGGLRWHLRWDERDVALETILADPEAVFSSPEVLLKLGNSSTVVACGDYVIKRDNYKRPLRRFVERMREGRSLRGLRRAFHLEISLLPTPRPVAAALSISGGLVKSGYLIVRRLRDAQNIDQAVKNAPEQERFDLLLSAGRLIARVHAAGFSHRDLKAGNIMADRGGGLWLVDLDGIRPAADLPEVRRMAEIERLIRDLTDRSALTVEERRLLHTAYSDAIGNGGNAR